MLNQPISSPMMTTMLGGFPDGGVDAACCACATLTGLFVAIAEAAASVVPPSNTLRRLRAWFVRCGLSPWSSLDIDRSRFELHIGIRRGSSTYPPLPHGARPAGSGGSNSARTDASRL